VTDREDEPQTIIVIDDDYAMRLSCSKILAKVGYRVESFDNGAEGVDGASRLRPALVVVDLKMPGISGLEVIARVREIDPLIVIVVITGYATIDTAVEAMKAGAYDFLPKPFSPEALRLIVERGLERRRLTLETRRCEVERELLKRRFITFVSHQLQTPLVAVHQYLDVLKHLGGNPDAERKGTEWVDRCLKRTEEMQKLIRDWLTLARLEGRCFSGKRERVDLKNAVSVVFQVYEQAAAAEGISLKARVTDEACAVKGDQTCVSVLLDNLVGNAIKYNRPGGSVTVTADPRDTEVEIAVSDTGIGIPEKYRPFLFDEFFRVEGESARKSSGTGLGLPICRQIMAELGGRITVESEVGAGSTFRVYLPAWREPGAPEEAGVHDERGRGPEKDSDCR